MKFNPTIKSFKETISIFMINKKRYRNFKGKFLNQRVKGKHLKD